MSGPPKPFTWHDPSIWEGEQALVLAAVRADLSSDDECFLQACSEVAVAPAYQLLAFERLGIAALPGFPGASSKVREAGQALISFAVQEAREGTGEVQP